MGLIFVMRLFRRSRLSLRLEPDQMSIIHICILHTDTLPASPIGK